MAPSSPRSNPVSFAEPLSPSYLSSLISSPLLSESCAPDPAASLASCKALSPLVLSGLYKGHSFSQHRQPLLPACLAPACSASRFDSCLPFSGKPFLIPLQPPGRVGTFLYMPQTLWAIRGLSPSVSPEIPPACSRPLENLWGTSPAWPFCPVQPGMFSYSLSRSQYLLLLPGRAKCHLLQEAFGNPGPHFMPAWNSPLPAPGVNSLSRHELSTCRAAAAHPGRPPNTAQQTLPGQEPVCSLNNSLGRWFSSELILPSPPLQTFGNVCRLSQLGVGGDTKIPWGRPRVLFDILQRTGPHNGNCWAPNVDRHEAEKPWSRACHI